MNCTRCEQNRRISIVRPVLLILALAVVVLLTACTSAPVQETPLLNPERKQVPIDPEVLKPCPDLQPLEVRDYSQGDALEQILAPWIRAYRTCQARQAGSVNILCSALNCTTGEVK